jgi:hypothetical protein
MGAWDGMTTWQTNFLSWSVRVKYTGSEVTLLSSVGYGDDVSLVGCERRAVHTIVEAKSDSTPRALLYVKVA